MRLSRAFAIAVVLSLIVSSHAVRAEEDKTPAKDAEPFLILRLVDEAGRPVADARAGLFLLLRDFNEQAGGNWDFTYGVKSNANGIVEFREGADRFRRERLVYARHAERRLAAVASFDGKKSNDNVVVVTLHPECHLKLRITCNQLDERECKFDRPLCMVRSDSGNHLFSYPGGDSVVHAFLPPGKFELECMARNCYPMSKPVEIKSGTNEIDLGVLNLPAARWALLEGKPAPELRDVIEWKNGPAIKLSDLRGKIVLLDFWGWWCSGCVTLDIPELFKLQDEFNETGLVIIGIHTPADEADEVNSVEKMDKKLVEVRQTIWKGRDITFPVAVTRFEEGRYYPGSPTAATSKLCLDYGIDSFPTTVLIDREGKVLGRFDASKEEDRARLKKLLGAK